MEQLVDLMRKLNKFPTVREIRLERNNNSDFPSKGVFHRLGSKEQIAFKVLAYCDNKNGFDDIKSYCDSVIKKWKKSRDGKPTTKWVLGEVYLFKSGRYYKIGKTNDTVRRGQELKVQLPERVHLIHSIKTDDPRGIETYWHKRFESKRMQGEWFDLSADDIKAFKRWRRIA